MIWILIPFLISILDLPTGTRHIGINFQSRYIATTNIILEKCSFSALLSLQGALEQTSGGTFYTNGFKAVFINCTFNSNTGRISGACVILNTESTFTACNFSKNYAQQEIGAILSEQSNLSIVDCIFQQNSAQYSVGAIRIFRSLAKLTDTIFDNNSALSKCTAIEIIFSQSNITQCQFSNNFCTQSHSPISIYIQENSNVTVIACKFRIDSGTNSHISSDQSSSMIIENSCFDAPKSSITSSILGNFEDTGNSYEQMCDCTSVIITSSIDVQSFDIEVSSKILRTDFIVNSLAILLTAAFFSYMTLRKEKEVTFVQLTE